MKNMSDTYYIYGALILPVLFLISRGIDFVSSFNLWTNESSNKENKIVVITGCDSGVGLELAKHSLQWGYYVIPCCLDCKSGGASLLQSLGLNPIQLNVCNKQLVSSLVEKVRELKTNGKELWCLVNNAGIMSYAKTEWLTWELVQSQILVNLSGTIQMSKALLPLIRSSKGRIINISSPQGIIASPYMSVYCASKWGVEAFSHCLRRETFDLGIKVIVLRPCNFPHKTSILERNGHYLSQMKASMNPETLRHYGPEIDALTTRFEENFSKSEKTESSDDINDQYLIESFRSALESRYPSQSYTAASITVRIFTKLFTLLPDVLMDKLVTMNFHTTVINWGMSQ